MSRIKLVILPRIDDAGGDLSKQWFVYYSYRNPRTGKMQRLKVYKGLGKQKTYQDRMAAAVKLRDELTDKIKNGWTPFEDDSVIYDDNLRYHNMALIYGRKRASVESFNLYANQWLESKREGLEKETVADYASKFRTFQAWLNANGYGQYDVREIDNGVMLAFFQYLTKERQSSRITYNKYKRYLRGVFDMLLESDKIQKNPIYNVPNITRVNDMTPRPIYDDDVETFKKELKKDRQLWLAVLFEYYCYLRPGKEIRLMRIKQIDFARGTITISKNIAKTKHDKIVIIPRPFLEILRNDYQLHTYPRDYFVIGKNGTPGPQHLGKNNLRYRFNGIRKKLNMPDEYKFYSWKHTGNVRADEAGISLNDRQKQNGHRYARTTEVYTQNKRGHFSDDIKNKYPEL